MATQEYLQFFKYLKSRPKMEMDLEQLRLFLEELLGKYSVPEDVNFETFSVGSIQATWVRPEGAEKKPVVLYFHGGGYIAGSLKSHRPFLAKLAKKSNLSHLFFEYRLAPEHPYPAALDDAMTMYNWLLHHHFSHNEIAFAGDSAGGGLLLALLHKLKLDQKPLPKCALAICPWVDLARKTYSDRNDFLKADQIPMSAMAYTQKHDLKEPYISPLYANLSDLPPTLIQTGTQELLHEEILELSAKMNTASLKIWPEMIHCWHFFDNYPEAQMAIDEAGEFLSSSFQS